MSVYILYLMNIKKHKFAYNLNFIKNIFLKLEKIIFIFTYLYNDISWEPNDHLWWYDAISPLQIGKLFEKIFYFFK